MWLLKWNDFFVILSDSNTITQVYVNIGWQFVRQITCAAKNRYYNANRTRHAFTHSSAIKRGLQLSWPQQKKVHLFLLISEDKILLSAAFRDESQVYAFKMGDLLHSAIEFMIDHWIALAIGLLVLLIHRYVCTMEQNVSSKIIHETPRWVKEKTNCVVFVLGSQSDPLRLFSRVTVGFELELSLRFEVGPSRMELSFKVPNNYAFRANFVFFTYFWRSWFCYHLWHV